MRYFSKTIAVVFMLIISIQASATTIQTKLHFGVIRTTPANVRRGPGKNYNTVAIFNTKFSPVAVKGKQNDWVFIEDAHGVSGWVKSGFVSTQKKERHAIIIVKKTTLCRLPIPDRCEKILTIKEGMLVKLLLCNNGWCRIRIDKKVSGWVSQDFLWGIAPNEKI